VLLRGAEIRLSPYPATSLLIVDDTAAIACDNPVFDHSDCTPTRSKAVIKLLQQVADMTWRTSWDLDAAAIVSQGVRLDVLRHLCAGHKDEVGARLLNMSLRTYRRHVADLLRMLGANSRFEAGARAVALGLLN
jgi:DNA-binding NarL/FixJ family response regulator